MKILITGFDPFDKDTINPSWEIVKSLPPVIEDVQIIKSEIPTVFIESRLKLIELMDRHSPDVVIAVGQAGGRDVISVERVAINIDDARIADNRGNRPIDDAIFADGDNAYFSNLPVKAIVRDLQSRKIPANLSNSAGTFVCNHIMYSLLYHIHKNNLSVRGGFVHVPYLPEQVAGKDLPSMSSELIRKALISAIGTVIDYNEDIRVSYGKEF